MDNKDNKGSDIRQDGFLAFVLKYIGIICAILAVGLIFAFSSGSIPTLAITILLALTFFLILLFRWDTYKRGAMFTITAVCVNVEHVSVSQTDYVFETLPEDETVEPQIFTLTAKRTKFRKYQQGVPYIMVFGMQKNSKELTSENLVTASKRVENYGGRGAGRGYIDLDDIGEVAKPVAEDEPQNATAGGMPDAKTAVKFSRSAAKEGEGDET